MSSMIARIRYKLINKPRHRKQKRRVVRAEIPYIGPAEWLSMKNSRVLS